MDGEFDHCLRSHVEDFGLNNPEVPDIMVKIPGGDRVNLITHGLSVPIKCGIAACRFTCYIRKFDNGSIGWIRQSSPDTCAAQQSRQDTGFGQLISLKTILEL